MRLFYIHNLFIDLEANENYLYNSNPTIVEFGWEDIVRSGVVRDYIMAKEMYMRKG